MPDKAVQAEGNEETSERSVGAVERVYHQLKGLAISFAFRPGERINEVAVARELGVSRTPLREALNRLTADGFLTFSPNAGFYRRPLDVKEIFDLYELRQHIEVGSVQLAVKRATPEALVEVEQFILESNAALPDRTIDDLVALDEGFHERLMGLTGNVEMLRVLQNVNARIRFLRWIDMSGRREFTQAEHRAIFEAVKSGDAATAMALLERHIHRRLDQVVDAVKESYARIYVDPNLRDISSTIKGQRGD
jgi:DNA-binding GntR family transcriptional regulator